MFGGTDFEMRMRVLDAVANEDTADALVAVGELLDAGFDPRRITEDLLATARDGFLLTSAKGRVRVDAPEDDVARLSALGEQTGPALLVRTLETLGQAIVDMRGTDAADPRLVLEIALVRLARRDAGPPMQALADRARPARAATRRRRRGGGARAARHRAAVPARSPAPRSRAVGSLRSGEDDRRAPAASGPRSRSLPSPSRPEPEPDPEPPPPRDAADAPPVDLDDVILAWSDLLGELPPATKAAAQEAQPLSVDDNVITFGVSPAQLPNAKPRFKKEADTIRDALSSRLGRRMLFRLDRPRGLRRRASALRCRRSSPPLDEPPPRRRRRRPHRAGRRRWQRCGGRFGERHRQRLDATVVEERPRD